MFRRTLLLAAASALALVAGAAPASAEYTTQATGCAPGIGAPHYICAKTQQDGASVRAIGQIFSNGSVQYCISARGVRLEGEVANDIIKTSTNTGVACSSTTGTVPSETFTLGCAKTFRSAVQYTYGGRTTVDIAFTGYWRSSGCFVKAAIKDTRTVDGIAKFKAVGTTARPLAGNAWTDVRPTADLVEKGKKSGACLRDAGFNVEVLADGGGHATFEPAAETKFWKAWEGCK